MHDEPRNKSLRTPISAAQWMMLVCRARLSSRKSAGRLAFALMPPTRAAARMTTSGLTSCIQACTSAWRRRSRRSRSTMTSSQSSRASRRISADPTMPRWPAIQIRRPSMRNGSSLGAIALSRPRHALQIGFHHFRDEPAETDAVAPAQLALRLGRIAEQLVDLGRPEVARIDRHQRLVRLVVGPGLLDAVATPYDAPPDMGECGFDEFAYRMGFAGGEHVIVGLRLLQHQPHAFHIVARMAPVALGVEIAEKQLALQPMGDRGDTAGDLAGDEGLAADRALMVEQNAVRGMDAIGFAIIHRDPIGIELRRAVGGARIERRGFRLRNLLDLAVHLRGRGLIEFDALLEAENADRLEQAQGADGVGIGGVFGGLETHLHMALGGQIVDFGRPYLLDDPDQAGAVGEVAVMEFE